MTHTYGSEYAVEKIDVEHYRVHKFCGHHGVYLTYYDIKRNNGWYCNCKAENTCKNLAMVYDAIKPKKSLF